MTKPNNAIQNRGRGVRDPIEKSRNRSQILLDLESLTAGRSTFASSRVQMDALMLFIGVGVVSVRWDRSS